MLLILEAAGMVEIRDLAVAFHPERHAVGEPVLHLPFGLERGHVAGIEIVDEKVSSVKPALRPESLAIGPSSSWSGLPSCKLI